MEQNWMVLLQQETQLAKVMEMNRVTEKYGLVLSEQDAKLIVSERVNALREQRRVEFGGGIVPRIIEEFCDSDFIDQSNYAETMIRLQEIFYLYKNEMQASDEGTVRDHLLRRSGLSGGNLPQHFLTGHTGRLQGLSGF